MSATKFPDRVLIVKAGVFGLSTALAISRRYPSTNITIVDRLAPPVSDGTSVDTTRCIRADYADPVYAKLAEDAQKAIKADPELQPHYFETGMSFICNGQPGRPYDICTQGLSNVKAQQGVQASVVEMRTPEDVFRRIHGPQSKLVPGDHLSRPRQWNMGYCNLVDAFVDAEACVDVYATRCRAQPSVSFACGVAVERLLSSSDGSVTGVLLENGRKLEADLTVLATGAWSPRLVKLGQRLEVSAIEVAWLKVTPTEAEKWKHMSITTNLDTGFNIFPPFKGEIKCLRRSAGYRNTVEVPDPDDSTRTTTISFPRTAVTHPDDKLPAEAESALRENLQELMPELADRPFERTRLCWLSQTPSADFIITSHPTRPGLHLVTGGSAHGWKFLPTIGDFAIDSIEGKLDPVLAEKWRWRSDGDLSEADGGSAHRMAGQAKELKDWVRSSRL